MRNNQGQTMGRLRRLQGGSGEGAGFTESRGRRRDSRIERAPINNRRTFQWGERKKNHQLSASGNQVGIGTETANHRRNRGHRDYGQFLA